MREIRIPLWLAYLLAVLPIWILTIGNYSVTQLVAALVTGIATLPLVRRILDLRDRVGMFRTLRRAGGILVAFFGLFVPDAIRSTLDMAWRLLQPTVPMQPGIVAVDVPFKDNVELMFLINHITLTPGQFVVDYDLDRGRLYVHSIDSGDPERIRREIRRLHLRGRRLMG